MKPDLDLNLLPVLDALISEGTVSRAAQFLGITQSAASHALRRLRGHFGDPLFVRVGNRMVPTPRLEAIEPFVRSMMEGLRVHLAPEVEFDPRWSTRTFSVSSSDFGEVFIVARIIQKLKQLAPRCRIRMVYASPRDAADALERGEIDLYLGSMRLTSEGLYQQQLFTHTLVCLVSEEFGGIERFERGAFEALSHIAINPTGEAEDLYDWIFQKNGLERRFALTTRSFLAVPLLVRATDFVATVPEPLFAAFDELSGLRCVEPPFDIAPIAIRQAWHPRFHTDPTNRWLRQLFYDVFAEARAHGHPRNLS